jgi:hypothetical protein
MTCYAVCGGFDRLNHRISYFLDSPQFEKACRLKDYFFAQTESRYLKRAVSQVLRRFAASAWFLHAKLSGQYSWATSGLFIPT